MNPSRVVNVCLFLLVASFDLSRCFFLVKKNTQRTRNSIQSFQLHAELRIRIQGTKNAYTVLREHDVVAYKLKEPVEGREVALGVYKDNLVYPLCNEVFGGSDFLVDWTQPPLDAIKLKNEELIHRMISADRAGAKYIIEEYIDDSFHIPVVAPQREEADTTTAPDITSNSIVTSSPSGETFHVLSCTAGSQELDILAAELRVAELQLKLLQAKRDLSKAAATAVTSVCTDKAPIPVGPYSQAVISGGLLFVSGCVGVDAATCKLVAGGVEAEAATALANLKAIVRAAGLQMSQLCKTVIMLDSIDDYRVVNALYEKFLVENSVTVFPARSTFAVKQLPLGALVEIEAIAVLNNHNQ